jgi:hypothetical protein
VRPTWGTIIAHVSERDAFTTDQWQALLDAAPAIARAVAATAGSAGETRTELGAFIDMVAEADSDNPGGLLGAIISDLYGRLAGGTPDDRADEPYMQGLEAARMAGAILSAEADPVEGRAAAAWFLLVAKRVAEAAREGGFMGIGGQRVSVHETEAIADIRHALGISESEGDEG